MIQGGDKSAVESKLPFGMEAFLAVFRSIVRTCSTCLQILVISFTVLVVRHRWAVMTSSARLTSSKRSVIDLRIVGYYSRLYLYAMPPINGMAVRSCNEWTQS
jgi:hypothetical protein